MNMSLRGIGTGSRICGRISNGSSAGPAWSRGRSFSTTCDPAGRLSLPRRFRPTSFVRGSEIPKPLPRPITCKSLRPISIGQPLRLYTSQRGTESGTATARKGWKCLATHSDTKQKSLGFSESILHLARSCKMGDGLYRSRTDTPFRALDFESNASANSAKRPRFNSPSEKPPFS